MAEDRKALAHQIIEDMSAVDPKTGKPLFTDSEIDDVLKAQGFTTISSANPDVLNVGPAGKSGLRGTQTAAMVAGPMLGGFYGGQLARGRNILPALGGVGRAITRVGGETLGGATGDVIGRIVAGQPQEPVESLKTGGIIGAGGAIYRGGTRLAGRIGGLGKDVVLAADEPVNLRVGETKIPIPVPNLQRVAQAAPHTAEAARAGVSAEGPLIDRAYRAARALRNTLTEWRQQKVQILDLATKGGVRLPVKDIQDALSGHLVTDPAPITRETTILNKRIQGVIDNLGKAADANGTLSPKQVDALIRQQIRPRVYSGTGQPVHNMFADAMSDAESAASDTLTKNLPGDLAEKNARISEHLKTVDNAKKIFGDPDRAGVFNKLRTAFLPGNETTAKALQTLSQHDKRLAEDAYDLYVRRQFGGDIREPAAGGQSGMFRSTIGVAGEESARAMAPFQGMVGPAAGGAYNAVMNWPQGQNEQVASNTAGGGLQRRVNPQEVLAALAQLLTSHSP